MNVNMSAMTVFLDIGCGLLAENKVGQAPEQASPGSGLDRSSLSARAVPLEGYQNLVISFRDAPGPRAGLGKLIAPRSEPQPELIKLLTRLKFRYCLQIAVIGFKLSGPNHRGVRKPELKNIVDYYITTNCVEISEQLRIRGIVHFDYTSTREKLASYGLWDV
jgi:hypothetical protein